MFFKRKIEIKSDNSIFDRIVRSIDEHGSLPLDFSLPNEDDTEKVSFAAGAMDGISMYHMGHKPLEAADKARLEEIIRLAGKKDAKKAEEGFAEFCKDHRAITIIDDLQKCIIDNKDILDPNVMHKFAVDMFLHSSNVECVKIGISILELFNTYDNEALAKAIRTVALSDEFTIFSVFHMKRWPTAEKDILECAKHVRGWGRIHCVEHINPEAAATKEWLLHNGTDNYVLPSYSAWNVFVKADVPTVLKRENLKYEEMHAILMITDALMDESPIIGISNLDNPKAFLNDVLYRAKADYPFTDVDLRIIEDIQNYIREEE